MIFNSHLYEQCFNLVTLFIWMRVFYRENRYLYKNKKCHKGIDKYNLIAYSLKHKD